MSSETPRIDYRGFQPGIKAAFGLHRAVNDSSLDQHLVELVRIRVSQINGCAYCVDVHTRDARKLGESERRIYALPAWHEAPFFTPRERAALQLTDAVTRLSGGVPDDVLDAVEEHFDEHELAVLLYAIAEVNLWNRLAIPARTPLVDEDVSAA